MNSIKPVQDSDEITLYDLIEVLIRRKVVILGILLASVVIALIYVLTLTPIYSVGARIELGKIGSLPAGADVRTGFSVKGFSIEEPSVVARKIHGKFGVKVSSAKTGILYLTKKSKEPGEAVESIEKLIQEFYPKHEEYYQELFRVASDHIKGIKTQLTMIDRQQSQLDKLKKNIKDNSMLMVLSEERNLQTRKVDLQKELVERKLLINGGTPPAILSKPVMPNKPINLRTQHTITLATILGLILGGILAFVMEFVVYFKARRLS